jgi:pilus assembly protein Flp/PilA
LTRGDAGRKNAFRGEKSAEFPHFLCYDFATSIQRRNDHNQPFRQTMGTFNMFTISKKLGYRSMLGQGMTEYIIIVALIAIAAIGVYSFFGQTVRQQTAGMAKELSGKKATTEIQGAQTAAGNASTEGTAKKGMGDYSNTVNK